MPSCDRPGVEARAFRFGLVGLRLQVLQLNLPVGLDGRVEDEPEDRVTYPTPAVASRVRTTRMAGFFRRNGYTGRVPAQVLAGARKGSCLRKERTSFVRCEADDLKPVFHRKPRRPLVELGARILDRG